jgi:hypothetical protein
MNIDYESLLEDLSSGDGNHQTVADRAKAVKLETLLNSVLAALSTPQRVEIPSIAIPQAPAAQVVVTPAQEAKPCSWDFVFTRNPDGSIKSIRANPVQE